MPKLIIHNSITLDGSFINFQPDMAAHYKIAAGFKPQAHLIGSNTIKEGIKLYGGKVPVETAADFHQPKRSKALPYWVVIDTRGSLKGLLHTCRQFELCRDVIVLVSRKTPKSYLKYLEERDYNHHVLGQDRVNLKQALAFLAKRYGAKRVMTDTGSILADLLLDQGLVDEVSLLVHPVVLGQKGKNFFGHLKSGLKLKLKTQKKLGKGLVWLVYQVN
ncbi:MAG: dihydrofolate reductase family protein [Candidatus Saganbacteria bacterium]|nr:dihydrofolate reductase family protein [Candidatus Saganbacteria bacterium]